MRLWKRAPVDLGGARAADARARARAAGRSRRRRAAGQDRRAARRLRPGLRRRRGRSRPAPAARPRGRRLPRPRRRDRRDRRRELRHLRRRSLRRVVGRRRQPAAAGERASPRCPAPRSLGIYAIGVLASLPVTFVPFHVLFEQRRLRRGVRGELAGVRAQHRCRCSSTRRPRCVLLGFGLADDGRRRSSLALPLWAAASYAAWKDIFGVREAPPSRRLMRAPTGYAGRRAD